jgi:uncharacterized protein (TIGR03000 family)
MTRYLPAPLLRLLAAATVLLVPAVARSQLVLGGHVTIGAPSSFAVSNGFGNYPGGDGFVPGFGYYPYYSYDPDRPSFLQRFHSKHRAPELPSAAPMFEAPPDAAVLVLRVPADAAVWFDGAPTSQGGNSRRFVTPPLADGKQSVYKLPVRWTEGGKPAERAERVHVYSGDLRTLDLTAQAAEDAPTLGAPRRVPRRATDRTTVKWLTGSTLILVPRQQRQRFVPASVAKEARIPALA